MSAVLMPPTEIASNIDADGLNAMWNSLVPAFDAYYDSMPKEAQQTISKAISDWQDFYYGNMGQWDATGIVLWRHVYSKTAELLGASVPWGSEAKALPVATTQAKASSAGKDTVFYVTGKPPAIIRDIQVPSFPSAVNLTSPWWYLAVLAAIPAAYIAANALGSRARRRRRLIMHLKGIRRV